MFKKLECALTAMLLFGLGAVRAQAAPEQILVAAAADLNFVFQQVAAGYERETGNTVKLSFGSSGNFFSQIRNGAPFDLFFSADIDYPRKLEAAGMVEPGSLYQYAIGRIVLWGPKDSAIEVERGLHILVEPRVRKIAIANPEHAPYGRAAVSAMQHEGIYEAVRDKLVLGENISQAAQFVESGNADVGIVALSLALAPTLRDHGRYFLIPPSLYPPLAQAGVILRSSPRKSAGRQFMDFLKRPESIKLLQQFGFAVRGAGADGIEKH